MQREPDVRKLRRGKTGSQRNREMETGGELRGPQMRGEAEERGERQRELGSAGAGETPAPWGRVRKRGTLSWDRL